MLFRILLCSALLLTGCTNSAQPVHVQILPTEYRLGDVQSQLATPVVDEVVRLGPERVQVSMCHSTPAAKVIQFQIELRARLKREMTAGYYQVCPEKSVAHPTPAPQLLVFDDGGMLRERAPADTRK